MPLQEERCVGKDLSRSHQRARRATISSDGEDRMEDARIAIRAKSGDAPTDCRREQCSDDLDSTASQLGRGAPN